MTLFNSDNENIEKNKILSEIEELKDAIISLQDKVAELERVVGEYEYSNNDINISDNYIEDYFDREKNI
ncbi:MAG TPA: hypothetical protein PKI83_03135 [Bacteroidales bacterium]|nr:hypothetical protein [Bacteroidales bacterium]